MDITMKLYLEAVSKPDRFVRLALFPSDGVDLTSK